MMDLDRAEKLAALFTHCGDRWRDVVPLDVAVAKDRRSVRVGSEVIVLDQNGKWRLAECSVSASTPDEALTEHDDRCACDECLPWEPGHEGHGYWGVD